MPTVGIQPDTEFFLSQIWGDEQAVVYVAFGKRENGAIVEWRKKFYTWPVDAYQILTDIESRKAHEEVYYCPALLKDADAHKESALGARVIWADFDGNPPSDLRGLPAPTIRIQSSEENRQHWYWCLDSVADPDTIESLNRALVHLFGADNSGWDITQVLRPPHTFNHKRQRSVEPIEIHDVRLPIGLFSALPPPPPVVTLAVPDSLPDVNDVVFKYRFPHKVAEVFKSSVEGPENGSAGRRSSALMYLAFSFAEMNLKDAEILTMISNAADRWHKFSGRTDRLARLMEIVTIARRKYPYKPTGEEGLTDLQLIGFKSLLSTEVHLEWVWHGWLQEGGFMLMTGPPAVGKTQVSLDIAGHFALGKDAIGRTVTKPRKIAFFSMEMGLVDVKEFMLLLQAAFTPEEQDVLEENFLILPLGEPLYTDNQDNRDAIDQMVGDYKLDGIIFDSLSSTISGELREEKPVKQLLDWNDRLRQKLNVFTWFIHHHRKASGDNKKPNKLDDVYGPYLLGARATSVFCLWPTKVANALEVIPLKVRLSQKPDPFYIRRDKNLHFEKVSNAAISMAPTGGGDAPNITVVDEPIDEGQERSKFSI